MKNDIFDIHETQFMWVFMSVPPSQLSGGRGVAWLPCYRISGLVDLWVIKIKKPVILCARSTSIDLVTLVTQRVTALLFSLLLSIMQSKIV